MQEPQRNNEMPPPRTLDNLLEIYVKIGGYMGMGSAVGVFAGICWLSYSMFYASGYVHSITFLLLLLVATLVSGALAAVSTFFCVSVFWLPMIFGLIFFGSLLQHAILRLRAIHF